jgi:quercetin dioxygenase-like cupin family protein
MTNALPFRRIVTGHDETGQATIVEDAQCPHAYPVTGGVITTELWSHAGPPNNSEGYADPISPDVVVPPPSRGSVFRVVEFPPGNGTEPYQHRTASLDYCFVISGEIYAIVENEERFMRAGDSLVQRGTLHSWDNRSSEPCCVLFVLIDAPPLDWLKQ